MSQGSRLRYVLDASVAMKWYLPDEQHSIESEALLTAFGRGEVVLIAPHHIHYEIPNALRTAVRRGRLAESRSRQAMLEFSNSTSQPSLAHS